MTFVQQLAWIAFLAAATMRPTSKESIADDTIDADIARADRMLAAFVRKFPERR